MTSALTNTEFAFPSQKSVYHGKVRDVYNINDEKLVMVATDRISAFDVILPEGIPFNIWINIQSIIRPALSFIALTL